MADATNTTQLESLVTTFTVDSGGFMTGADAVMKKTDEVALKLSQLSGDVILMVNSMTSVATTATTVLGNTAAAISQIGQAIATAIPVNATNGINGLKNALGGRWVNRLNTLSQNITGFATALGTLSGTAGTINNLQTELGDLITWLSTNASNFPKPALQVARALSKITSAVHDMTLVQPGVMLKNAQAMAQAMQVIASVGSIPGMSQAVNLIARASRAMQGMQGMAGGGIPPIIPPIVGRGGGAGGGGAAGAGLRNTAAAANSAGMSFRSLAYDSMVLQRNAEGAGGALISLRYGLLGLGALGLYQFSQMDDALIRLSARTRDFGFEFREQMREGLIAQTGHSINSITEQGKALERLRTAGLNATAAIENLATADNFATAAGMKMGLATKGLTDLMHAMDLTGNTAEEFRTNMKELSDLLVGVSTRTGATEQQLMEAFSSRFQTSARLAGMSLKDSMAVIGAFARAGDHMRGQKGGNIAARGISQLMGAIGEQPQWLQMFGITAHDAAGNARPLVDILSEMQKKMAGVDTDKFLSTLKMAGLGTSETTFAIEPLLRTLATMKDLREEMEKMGGTSEKMADTIRTSLMSQIYILGNSLGNASAVIGERLAPALYMLIKPVVDLLNAFAELNPAIQNLIVYGGLVLIAWRPVLWLFSTLASTIVNLATMPFRLLYNSVTGLWSVLKTLAGWVGTAFAGLGRVIYYTVGVPLGWLIERFIDFTVLAKRAVDFLFVELAKWTGAISSVVATVFQGIFVGMFSLVMSLLSTALLLPPLLAGITFALAGLGGLVATVGLTIYQLGEIAVAGLAKAWVAVRDNSREALQWMGNAIVEVTEATKTMWGVVQQGGLAFVETASAVIKTWAGLLWNIKENFAVVVAFVEKYGAEPFADIIKATMTAMEVLGSNIVQLAKGLGTVIKIAFDALWQGIKNVGGAVRMWFLGSWENITGDINNIFNTFMDNFLHNWSVMAEAMGVIIKNNIISHILSALLTLDKIVPGFGKVMFGEAVRSGLFAGESDEKAIEKAKKNLKGISTGLEPFNTDFTALYNMVTGELGRNKAIWETAGEEMASAFSESFAKTNPIFAAFRELADTPMWQELLFALNFTMPTLKEVAALFTRPLNLGMGDEGVGSALGKGGPGFQFKQGSMERFIYDGNMNEKIQWQQLYHLRSLDKNVQILATQRGQGPPGRPVPGPPATGATWHPPMVLGD